MGRIKRVAFALLAAVLWGAALSGCSVIEFNMDKWALEYDINVYCKSEDFFASHTSDLGYGYNFLDFDYHGQPLEEVLPLLKDIRFDYRYVDDSVSLDNIELREEDWGGLLDSLSARISCFRCYDENSEVPLGIQIVKGQPVMMAEGMEFSRSESHFYADLDKIAYAVPYLSLRERLDIRDGQMTRERYTVTRMGNFWVSTSDGWSAEEHPYSWQVSPLHVTVIPSLVYKSGAQMGVGKILEEEDGSHHGVNLFTYYLDRKKYWMNGLEFLTFTRPSELVLLRVVE